MRRRELMLTLAALLVVAGAGYFAYWHWRNNRYNRDIVAAARRYGVDPALVKAVVWRESRFDAGARGRAGEIGLMQIGELAAQEWADAERVPGFRHEQVLDPRTNLLAGTWYLARLLRRYSSADDSRPYGLADYNAGRSRVVLWKHGAGATNSAVFLTQIGFPGTRRYVEEILRRREQYAGLTGGHTQPARTGPP
jgi:soluble lytic murein transglycosylase